MNKKYHKKVLLGGAIATLSFLPGCMDMFKSGNDQVVAESPQAKEKLTGEVLVTKKGEPVITTDSLEVYKENLLKANPQIRQALAFMQPKVFERNILDGLLSDKVIAEYVAINKINEKPEYKAELQDLYEAMERMLNAKYFSEQKAVNVSDAEIKTYYEMIKTQEPGMTVSQGGVVATGLEFADASAAQAFMARVKSSPGGFKKVAQDDGLSAKVSDFKMVNKNSMGIDPQLRDKIVEISTVPSVEMIEAEGKFWVINATEKEEPKYIPYEQIKDMLRQKLEQEKRVAIFEQEMKKLRSDYDVQINEEYFAQEAPEQAQPARTGGVAQAESNQERAEQRIA